MNSIVNNATDVLNVGPESVAGVTTQTQAANSNALTWAISPPDHSSESCTQSDGPAAEERRIVSKQDTVAVNVIVDATYPGIHKQKEQYYTLAGNLEATGSITIKLDAYLYVAERIRAGGDIIADKAVRAGWSIKAQGNIKAKESLRAGQGILAGKDIETAWYLEADKLIKAGKSIRVGEGIRSGEYIEAGEGIEAGFDILSALGVRAKKTIKCQRLIVGTCVSHECTPEEQRVVCTEFQGKLVCGNLVKTIPQEHKAPLRLIISGVLS